MITLTVGIVLRSFRRTGSYSLLCGSKGTSSPLLCNINSEIRRRRAVRKKYNPFSEFASWRSRHAFFRRSRSRVYRPCAVCSASKPLPSSTGTDQDLGEPVLQRSFWMIPVSKRALNDKPQQTTRTILRKRVLVEWRWVGRPTWPLFFLFPLQLGQRWPRPYVATWRLRRIFKPPALLAGRSADAPTAFA